MLTAELLSAVGCARPVTWLAVLPEACSRFGITTPRRMADFLSQVAHESAGLSRLTENLNYRAERIVQVWPSRFRSVADAKPYAQNPQALGNKVYGGRMGNTAPGDGWKYRGRGLIQVTGRDNYVGVRDDLRAAGVRCPDFVADPDSLAEPRWAAYSAAAWWQDRGLNDLADTGDFRKQTIRINGGVNGLSDREARRARAVAALQRATA
jgi:putative chitinase